MSVKYVLVLYVNFNNNNYKNRGVLVFLEGDKNGLIISCKLFENLV